jgi:hypothetical protein
MALLSAADDTKELRDPTLDPLTDALAILLVRTGRTRRILHLGSIEKATFTAYYNQSK